MWSVEADQQLRHAAFAWLAARTHDGALPIRFDELGDFEFEGQRIPLMDRQRGIRKPAFLDAALSMRTVYRAERSQRPYEDDIGPDGLQRYQWRGTERAHPENRALRRAMEQRLPLIWFRGVGPAEYLPIFPIYLVGEEPAERRFALALDETYEMRSADLAESPAEEALRRYVLRETKQRLHQPVFRATVLRAYERRCAVCALGHDRLLDAAHIVPDSDERGEPTVRNGLSLCSLHHAAFDAHLLGIRPDLVVEIPHRLLDEVDGPTLTHALKGRHGQRLMVLPSRRQERPDTELLELHYRQYRTATSG